VTTGVENLGSRLTQEEEGRAQACVTSFLGVIETRRGRLLTPEERKLIDVPGLIKVAENIIVENR